MVTHVSFKMHDLVCEGALTNDGAMMQHKQ
jgi:hypothetical protein